jgi:hypothetical protein
LLDQRRPGYRSAAGKTPDRKEDGGNMTTSRHSFALALMITVVCGGSPLPSFSQAPPQDMPPPPDAPPQQDMPPPPASKPAPSAASLDKLVAPIALYPDALVAQILPASTHPLQVVEAAESVANAARPTQAQAAQWYPSVQALVSFPTVLKMMHDKIEWTEQLGKAVAADQSAVMASIQSVRAAALRAGNLKSNDKQVVDVQAQGSGGTITTIIVIEPATPQVIYVPQYNPVLITAPPPPSYGYPPPYDDLRLGVRRGCGHRLRLQLGTRQLRQRYREQHVHSARRA